MKWGERSVGHFVFLSLCVRVMASAAVAASSSSASAGAAVPADVEFNNVYCLESEQGESTAGKLLLGPSRVVWAARRNNERKRLPLAEVEEVEWCKLSNGCRLRFIARGNMVLSFMGLRDNDLPGVEHFVRKRLSGTEIKKTKISLSGKNWGGLEFEGKSLTFKVDNKPTIDINLNDVINCTNSKNEVALQFRRENDVVGDALAEMRFYVPSAEDSQTSDGGLSGPEAIVRRVSELSDLDSGSGQLVVAFDKLQMLVPRTTFDFQMFSEFVRMLGPTYNTKIFYKDIRKTLMLPSNDPTKIFLVIELTRPLRLGATSYKEIVISLNEDEEIKDSDPVIFNLPPEKLAELPGNPQREMSGRFSHIVGVAFKALSQKRVIGAGKFTSSEGLKCLPCSLKNYSGLLYPLEQNIIFLHRPVHIIPHKHISKVVLNRTATGTMASSNFFEFQIFRKDASTSLDFNNVDKAELNAFQEYLQAKGIPVVRKKEDPLKMPHAGIGGYELGEDSLEGGPSGGVGSILDVDLGGSDSDEDDGAFSASSSSESGDSDEGDDGSGDEEFQMEDAPVSPVHSADEGGKGGRRGSKARRNRGAAGTKRASDGGDEGSEDDGSPDKKKKKKNTK